MKTYLTLYQNEIRAIELTIRDQDEAEYEPSTAYVTVVNEDGTPIVYETVAQVTGNKVYYLISTRVTETTGTYNIIWKIVKTGTDTYNYYHKTVLTVEEL